MACRDDLVKYYDKQISMGSSENRNVNGHCGCVGLIQSNPEIPLAAQ